jgi:hypothetical protein
MVEAAAARDMSMKKILEVETDGSGSIERLITVGDCEEASRG